VAEGVAAAAYPHGFEAHYWRPEELERWARVQQPTRIFWDSMADLFGHWVATDQVQAVLDAASVAQWHTFLSLTKNAPRLLQFDLPANVWPGISSPPDFMWGRRVSRDTQARMLRRMLAVLSKIKGRITWASFEPLSWDVASIVAEYPGALRWAVIGAASNGKIKYQPDPAHVQALLDVLDAQGVPVFFKGNLQWLPRRERFPDA
jgi:protein gp37